MAKKYSADVMEVCKYIHDTGCTVRDAAKHFGIGKSTVHNYCRLCPDETLKIDLENIAAKNFAVKHMRGGLSTKKRKERG